MSMYEDDIRVLEILIDEIGITEVVANLANLMVGKAGEGRTDVERAWDKARLHVEVCQQALEEIHYSGTEKPL